MGVARTLSRGESCDMEECYSTTKWAVWVRMAFAGSDSRGNSSNVERYSAMEWEVIADVISFLPRKLAEGVISAELRHRSSPKQFGTFDLSSCQFLRGAWRPTVPISPLVTSSFPGRDIPQHPTTARYDLACKITFASADDGFIRLARHPSSRRRRFVQIRIRSCTATRLSHIPRFARISPLRGHHDGTTHPSSFS